MKKIQKSDDSTLLEIKFEVFVDNFVLFWKKIWEK